MTGSLQIKNNKFYIVLNINDRGKRKQKWISTGLAVKGNKRKAEKLLRETITEYENKPETIPCDMQFSEYVRLWLSEVKRRVDPITLQGYELSANVHVIPWFENCGVTIKEVDRTILQSFFDEMAVSGRKDGKGGLSPASLRQYKNIINQTLNEAVKNNIILSNPCQYVELPKKRQYESKYYSAEQLKTLFAAIQDDPLYPLVKITVLYGLRRSEVLGLKWDSIDFDSNILTIKHTVSKVSGIVEKDKTKNMSSHRSFPLTEEAREIFLAVRGSESEDRNLCGKKYKENDYVFKWPDGTPFSPDYVTSHFQLLLKKHNLPHIRFHELRHSCASLLLNNGYTLKDVQEYMGHSDIKMTANIYGHLDQARKRALTNGVSSSLFGGC